MNIDDSFLSQMQFGEASRRQALNVQHGIEESNRQLREATAAAAAKKQAEREHDLALMEEQTRLARESADSARVSADLARESGATARRGYWVAVASLVVAVIAVAVAVLAIVLTN